MASIARNLIDEPTTSKEKWQDRRVRTLCKDCGHPRSEHHAIFNAIAGEYIHTRCKDADCECDEFLERPEKEVPPLRRLTRNNPAKDLDSRCKACGSLQKDHIYLGPECITGCEANWKMLDILRRNGVITPAKL